jgi:hypothetical protein
MKIQYCSDLHLEFPENRALLKSKPLEPVGDILVIAGDFFLFNSSIDLISNFISSVSENFKTVYWLPGNHEYYGSDASQAAASVMKNIAGNVFLVNNTSVQFDHINIIFSTFWSEIKLLNAFSCERGVSDFEVILLNGKPISAVEFNSFHRKSVDFIEEELIKHSDKMNIMVTHHVPTLFNYPKKYLNSVINNAFATELSTLSEKHSIHSWIYGHSHINTLPFTLYMTEYLTNQLGYVALGENISFKRDAFIEI